MKEFKSNIYYKAPKNTVMLKVDDSTTICVVSAKQLWGETDEKTKKLYAIVKDDYPNCIPLCTEMIRNEVHLFLAGEYYNVHNPYQVIDVVCPGDSKRTQVSKLIDNKKHLLEIGNFPRLENFINELSKLPLPPRDLFVNNKLDDF